MLKTVGYYFKDKDFKSLTAKDIEKFMHALDGNKIKKDNGDKYSEQTKSNIKRTLKLLLRWQFGEQSKKFYDMTYWIDTRFQEKTIQSLTESEIKGIIKKCNTIKQKVLIACLFDGGFRIEEFLNVRNSDIKIEDGNVPIYRITIRQEFSKTLGRDVGMFWNNSFEIIKDWFDSKQTSKKPDEQFFDGTYDGVRKLLKKLGDRFGKKLNAHLFRHSSATFYANKRLNEFQMNKRFGWSPGSDMGRKYVDNAQIQDTAQVKEYEDHKFGEIKTKLRIQEEENKIRGDKIQHMEESQETIAKKINLLLKVLKKNPRAIDVMAKRDGKALREVFS